MGGQESSHFVGLLLIKHLVNLSTRLMKTMHSESSLLSESSRFSRKSNQSVSVSFK